MRPSGEHNSWSIADVLVEMGCAHLNNDDTRFLLLWTAGNAPLFLPADRLIPREDIDQILQSNEINTEEFWARYEEHHVHS